MSVTAERVLLSLCVVLAIVVLVQCQIPWPRLEHKGSVFRNNSFIHRRGIGEGDDDSLKCLTNNTRCCTDPDVGNWTDERGGAVHQGASGAITIYVTRGDGVVSLNRITGGSAGMWRCDIPDSSGVMQSLYIYTGVNAVNKGALFVSVL